MWIFNNNLKQGFKRLRDYASSIRSKFSAGVEAEELRADTLNLDAIWETFKPSLPLEVRNVSNFERHISWMKRRLKEGEPDLCRQDIEDICEFDINEIEEALDNWWKDEKNVDIELLNETSELIGRNELDSAIRKSFVILTKRIRSKFEAPSNLDGMNLINNIFGSSEIPNSDRQAWRDLLSGLYGRYRNKYAHSETEASWHEADAIISMVNTLLKDIERLDIDGIEE